MRREGNLSSLTDGKLYRSSDMARLGCNDCEGCSACCKGMGNSVVLDPYDVWRLERGLRIPFAGMIGKQVMLSVVDDLILPSLNMEGETGACPFLNEEGRCSIHAFRPGICRLFPLGRYYHDGGFSYVLMTGECRKENRSKVKIDKWLGETNLKEYEQFVLEWKDILTRTRQRIEETISNSEAAEEEGNAEEKGREERQAAAMEQQKKISMELLQRYYLTPYGVSFFAEFHTR
ncbi:MAG: YkgJ family cysteine cluster protein [Lachnospiraceae bacterium]|nr:YkgJ family cysteine cluster protein [Lachnospiraceae bacterium]